MKISLRDFAATGKFGAIELGTRRANVRDILSEPPNWGAPSENPERAAIWKYGDIEFYFSEDVLWMIFTDDFNIPRGCEQFELDAWKVKSNCTPNEMKAYLSEENIAYRVENFPYIDSSVRLICESGTTMTFGSEDSGGLKMFSISHSISL